MLFNSLDFLIFFPAVVGLHFLLPQRLRWVLLLAASYFFYMYWRAEYAILIFASTVIDFLVARKMASLPTRRERRPLLLISLVANLGALFFFKYFNFFNGEVARLAEAVGVSYAVPALNVLLPVGISFYTFQTLSYSIDVYYGRLEPEPHFGRFALFVSFFPQLVAGPIERASRFLPQLRREVHFDYDRVISGLKQMTWGFFKKVVIADRLALYVDAVYSSPGDYQGLPLILATYFFAFQIYADFSGYSDIAIGAARVLGYDLMENFRRPYLSRSISEFWKRWHISLSTWFRDYLYIPLGGNRTSVARWYANLFIVFVVSGAWHGANWTFMVWGALHGAYLVAAILSADLRQKLGERLPIFGRWWEVFVVFHLALLAWVFFRAASVSDALLVLSQSAVGLGAQLASVAALDARYLDALLVGGVGVSRFDFALSVGLVAFLFLAELAVEQGWSERWLDRWALLRLVGYDALVLAVLLLGVFGQTQFIYFQF